MGGFFGTISKKNCVADLFYGTDYNSHLGTRRAGMATYSEEKGMVRSIHNIEGSYFRSKFEDGLHKFDGATSGIGVISDTDAQPIIIHSHLGKMAIVTVARIDNIVELEAELLGRGHHFTELSSGKTNQTEVIATLINEGKTLEEGIQNMFKHIKGSCSLLILREDGIYAVRDKLGRSPIIIGKKDGAYAVSSETNAFPNLDYDIDYYIGPGEIIKITADGWTQVRNLGPRQVKALLARDPLNVGLIANQQKFGVKLLCGLDKAFYGFLGSLVASHYVNDNFHICPPWRKSIFCGTKGL